MDVLVGDAMVRPLTQLILNRAAAVFYDMDHIFSANNSSTRKILALSIEKPRQASRSARLTGCVAFTNSFITRIRLAVGLTPLLSNVLSISVLLIIVNFTAKVIKKSQFIPPTVAVIYQYRHSHNTIHNNFCRYLYK